MQQQIIFEKDEKKPNEKQAECINFRNGIMLALAGPGTGKTFSISRRIKSILEENIPPEKILCLTYTDTAAGEMRKAVAKIFDEKTAQRLNIFTYHSLCLEIIDNNRELFPEAGFGEIKKISEITQYKLAKECIDELEPVLNSKNNPYAKITDLIRKTGEIKKNLIKKEDYFRNLENHPDWGEKLRKKEAEKENCIKNNKKITKTLESEITSTKEKIEKARELWDFYELYTSKMQKLSLIDFNDMITFVLNKFEEDEGFLEKIASNYLHILVDEYQDTNTLQNKIIFNLIDKMQTKNAFLVGDDDQTIYSFQGAHINNIGRLIEKYSKEENFKVVCLSENRRSTDEILNFSYNVSTKDPLRLENNPEYEKFSINKRLEAKNEKLFEKNKPVRFTEYFSQSAEENAIVSEIKALIDSKDCPEDEKGEKKLNEIAIFAKTNKELTSYAEKLKAKDIPYELKDGKSIFEIKSSITLYLYLKFLSNEALYENYAMQLFLNPPFKLPAGVFKKLYTARHKKGEELFTRDIKNFLKAEDCKELQAFMETYEYLKNLESSENLRTVILSAAQKTGIYSYFTTSEINKSENIAGLKKILQTAVDMMKDNSLATLSDFVEYLELSRENNFSILVDKPPFAQNAIQLSTYHSSKGREFEIVYMPNLKRASWESSSKSTGAEIPVDEIISEEEKKQQKLSNEVKLMFVGLTRAKHTLNLSCAQDARFGVTGIIKPFIDNTNHILHEATPESFEADSIQTLEKEDFNYKKEFEELVKSILAEISYSPSSINTYLRCPAQYLFSNVLKLDTKSNFKDEANYGTAMHYALQKAFCLAKEKGFYPEKSDFYKFFLEKFDDLIISEKQIRKIMQQKAKESLENFYEYFTKIPAQELFECEYRLSNVDFEGIKTSGIIDRIDLNPDGTVTISDYKTGKKKSSDVKIGGARQEYLLQLFLYKAIFEQKTGKKVSKLQIILPDDSENSFEIPTDEALEDEALSIFKSAYKSIQELNFEKNKSSCRTCAFKDLCISFE